MTKLEIETKLKEYIAAYDAGESLVLDEVYDSLANKLREIDPDNPLIHSGQEEFKTTESKIKHTLVTGTLAKAADYDEFKDWLKNKPAREYSLEMKVDGSGIELQYVSGKLIQAITRGNGFEGVDRTKTVLEIIGDKNIGDFTGSIRGEMVIFKSTFEEKFAKDYANGRNLVAGMMNRKYEDMSAADLAKLKSIHFIAYDALKKSGEFTTQSELIAWLENYFEVPSHKLVSATESSFEKTVIEMRDSVRKFEYDCDGVVIKSNVIDRKDRQLRTPKNDIALKPELQQATSKVVDIVWELTGETLTPIAVIEPVKLEGTTVKRASLCNLSVMMDLDIEIGSLVVVEKRGLIIPKIAAVLK